MYCVKKNRTSLYYIVFIIILARGQLLQKGITCDLNLMRPRCQVHVDLMTTSAEGNSSAMCVTSSTERRLNKKGLHFIPLFRHFTAIPPDPALTRFVGLVLGADYRIIRDESPTYVPFCYRGLAFVSAIVGRSWCQSGWYWSWFNLISLVDWDRLLLVTLGSS